MQESSPLLDWSQASQESVEFALPELFEQVPQLKLHQVGCPAVSPGFMAQQGMAQQGGAQQGGAGMGVGTCVGRFGI